MVEELVGSLGLEMSKLPNAPGGRIVRVPGYSQADCIVQLERVYRLVHVAPKSAETVPVGDIRDFVLSLEKVPPAKVLSATVLPAKDPPAKDPPAIPLAALEPQHQVHLDSKVSTLQADCGLFPYTHTIVCREIACRWNIYTMCLGENT